MRKYIFLILMISASLQMFAKEEVTLRASAPEVVVNGDQFRLTYTVNSQDVKDFLAPQAKGFDVLMGPSRSQQSSTQIINGKVSSSRSITYTYILMAVSEGTFNIPSASIEVDGEKIFSNPLTIKVLPKDKEDANSNQGNSGISSRNQKSSGRITDNDLFVLATASKTKVHEQEAILVTYKAYTTVDLRQLLGKMPDQQGFYVQEVELPTQKTFKLEHYKGRNYNTVVYRQYVLFPQKAGRLEIPAVTFDAVVAQRVAVSDDPFEAFFNGGGYVEVNKKIVAPKVVINVEPLPSKPEGYSGGVGTFTMKSDISTTELKANEAVTIKLTISGTGNMKLVSAPEVKFPHDFEIYDPKIDDNYQLTADGLSGTKTIEYLAIPRHAGNFTIPPIEFKYFDIKSESYKTLKTDAYTLKVNKGDGSSANQQVIADFTNKESVKVLGTDILFIKTGDSALMQKGKYFFGTTAYYLWYIVPFVLFIVFVVIYRKQAVENANVARVKTKKANKVATKRMKLAGKLLSENKVNEFYDEVLKALWGYISDKLNIPVSKLSRDNIEAELAGHGVSEELIKEFIGALSECEFARYAPGNQNEAMDKVYSASVDVISKMENSIKTLKH
ncbi:protein BatD [Bacteroides caecigallinarum]|uniref:BatD family protein n=1 Tax=Bacteroides caecigallinarum TaxID=1411144 RepID=UPI0019566182|nr:BatD family protein [Bacteroides caecigallinarum]MBM6864390.1 protein BatD [Bacteroides caecigallinarum]